MTKLDIGILILVGLAGISCCRAGFTRSVWGVFVIGAGFFVACQFWHQLAAFLQKLIANPAWTKWLSIVAIVIVVSILVDSLFERIQRILEKGVLGWANRLLGFCFGIASGGLVIACALILLNTYGGNGFKNEISDSRFAPQLIDIGNNVWAVSKEHVQRQFDTE
ncbi:MAG: CvpA family protein [Candidatus Poribacteria bacterium]|nr:CvpA family protein [Candidatus Poribacteria bacterium]